MGNEIDQIYELIELYKSRQKEEKNEEKQLKLAEIIGSLKKALYLVEDYLSQ